MAKMTVDDLKKNSSEVFEFEDPAGLYIYKRDNDARDAFNKMMGAKVCKYFFRKIEDIRYLNKDAFSKDNAFHLDTESYLVMANGNVVRITNSEWASFTKI